MPCRLFARWASSCSARSCISARLLRGGQPPHDELHHVALHVAEQQLLLGFLGEHLGVVEGHVARELERALRHVVRAFGVVHAEADAVAQPVLAHAPGRGERQDHLLARLVAELQGGVGARRLVDHPGVGAGLDVALEVERDAAARARDVERLERHLRRAAQAKAAAREHHQDHEEELFQTTRFTRRPGTTTTFFTFCPATNFCTLGLASARPSMAPRSAAFGTRIEPRSLPLTCTTSSTSSCSRAAGSGSGHGALSTSSPKPSSRHSWCVTCGAMGDSSRSRIESPSFEVASHSGSSSSAFRIFMHAEATVLNFCRSTSSFAFLSSRWIWKRTFASTLSAHFARENL